MAQCGAQLAIFGRREVSADERAPAWYVDDMWVSSNTYGEAKVEWQG